MKTQRRWMVSILNEAARCNVRMPWERGLRRAATVARRKSAPQPIQAPVPLARRVGT